MNWKAPFPRSGRTILRNYAVDASPAVLLVLVLDFAGIFDDENENEDDLPLRQKHNPAILNLDPGKFRRVSGRGFQSCYGGGCPISWFTVWRMKRWAVKIFMAEGYCVKCKAKKEIVDGVEETMKNGRRAIKGKCPTCGTVMFKILGKSAVGATSTAPASNNPPAAS
jgi:hypothetical protein